MDRLHEHAPLALIERPPETSFRPVDEVSADPFPFGRTASSRCVVSCDGPSRRPAVTRSMSHVPTAPATAPPRGTG